MLYVCLGLAIYDLRHLTDIFFCDKEQFIYDLPARLGKCIESEAYADAVRFYTGALPIFKVNSDCFIPLFSLSLCQFFALLFVSGHDFYISMFICL